MKTPSEYVEAHLPLLNALSRSSRFRPGWVNADEFRSDLVDQVLTAHSTFRQINDPKIKECPHCGRRGCSTWIGWRARRVATDRVREMKSTQEYIVPDVDVSAVAAPSEEGSPSRIYTRMQIRQLFGVATEQQRDAMISKLEGWSPKEVRARLGISSQGRDYHLAKLAKSVR